MKTKVTTRHTLTGLALLFAIPLQAQEWSFEVYLDQQKIGTHTFSLDQNQLQSRANFKVKVLFINAYRYQHQADEQWQGNCLSQLTAHTEENKEITDVKGAIQNNQFVLEKNGSAQTLPGCIMTFAYWNPEILKQSRLLNPQNAEYLDVTVTDEGSKTIEVKGQTTLTHQYRLNGRLKGKDKLKITLWYDQQQQWVALESITPEGYKIKYKLI
ncbi:hypothetical protein INP77_00545 [Methylophilus sp. 13]|uniref:DUF6134 family protein n=1 Tax=Methylophilus sp. 13 TaxID=2781018 RepID=UPI0018903846|nr:DUF6134 family protein [Methylophilus sp. 13]MBF5037969.1 hypothetical protein [Methylophilus sp. 13]